MNFSQTTCERSATGLFISLRIFLFYGKWLLLYRIMDEISDMFILYRAIHFSHELWKQVLFSLKAFCFVNAPCDRFFSLFRFYLIVFWKLVVFLWYYLLQNYFCLVIWTIQYASKNRRQNTLFCWNVASSLKYCFLCSKFTL